MAQTGTLFEKHNISSKIRSSCQDLKCTVLWSVFLILAGLIGANMYLIVVLMCISLMISGAYLPFVDLLW